MCNICGIYNFDTSEHIIEKDILQQMNEAAIHRGPDDAGIFCEDNIGLAHRRLSIIDLKTGQQPMHNETGDIWIVYNGEVYNFQELRKILIDRGHRFYTKSDTEVILHSYEEYGEDCLDKFIGMFAFAIYDRRINKLFLARDRFGIKPLYYCILNNKIIFASEIKCLLKYPEFKKDLDFEALSQYLSFEYVPCPRTIFKFAKKLPAAHRLVCRKGQIKIERYWNPLLYMNRGSRKIKDENYYIENLRMLLKESIKLEMISDVPLGIFLSGGMDSSVIAAFASTVSDKRIKTFSIGFDDKSLNELQFARLIAKNFATEHQELIITPTSVIGMIPDVLSSLDEPFADASVIPTYAVSKLTKRYVKVALSGDGGDELFGGYVTYQAHKFARYYLTLPTFFKNSIKNIASILPTKYSHLSLDFKIKKFLLGIDYPFYQRHFIWWGAFSPQLQKYLFNETINSILNDFNPHNIILEYLRSLPKEFGDLDAIMYLDLIFNLQDDYLVKVDRMSMANSLETRVPFLDHRLAEFSLAMPVEFKIKNFQTKYILKKAMQRILPPAIVKKKKGGFNVPLGKWIRQDLKDFVLDHLSEERINRHNIFNYSFIRKIIDEHFSGKSNNRQLIWPLVVFEYWHKKYIGT